ncbi:hypothetical protein GCM10008931_38330 [Oceanobacillus oncorhynchi subsp. oncorhynchi]
MAVISIIEQNLKINFSYIEEPFIISFFHTLKIYFSLFFILTKALRNILLRYLFRIK